MFSLSLFHVYRFMLVTFVILYAGSWLAALASEALRRRWAQRASGRAGLRLGLRAAYGARWRRDAWEIGLLSAALGILIVLHG